MHACNYLEDAGRLNENEGMTYFILSRAGGQVLFEDLFWSTERHDKPVVIIRKMA